MKQNKEPSKPDDEDLLENMYPGMWVPPERLVHLSECFLVMYPDDPGAYCTCDDWSPEV